MRFHAIKKILGNEPYVGCLRGKRKGLEYFCYLHLQGFSDARLTCRHDFFEAVVSLVKGEAELFTVNLIAMFLIEPIKAVLPCGTVGIQGAAEIKKTGLKGFNLPGQRMQMDRLHAFHANEPYKAQIAYANLGFISVSYVFSCPL